MRPGDEYIVRMPGPWDGPVRVVEVGVCGFGFMTLTGTRRRARSPAPGERRAGATASRSSPGAQQRPFPRHVLAPEAGQGDPAPMWTSLLGNGSSTCSRPVGRAACDLTRGVGTYRRRARPVAARAGDPERGWRTSATGVNSTPGARRVHAGARLARGRHDRALPRERPGPPAEGGAGRSAQAIASTTTSPTRVERARRLRRDEPLERDMLLIRFGRGPTSASRWVYDEAPASSRTAGGLVFGWFRTLEGHFEQGQMN